VIIFLLLLHPSQFLLFIFFLFKFFSSHLHDLITFFPWRQVSFHPWKSSKFWMRRGAMEVDGSFQLNKVQDTHACRHPFARFDYNNLYNRKNKNMHSTLQISSKLFFISRHDPPLLTIFVMQKTKTCIQHYKFL